MVDEKKYFQILSSLYETAVDSNKWPEVLDQLAPIVGAKTSALLLVSANNNYDYAVSVSCSAISDEAKKIYVQDYSSYEEEHFKRTVATPAGTIINEREFFKDKSVFDNRPDVVFLKERLGVHERFAVKLNNEPSWVECITFQYETGRENIRAAELANFQYFYPHLSKVTQISRTFSLLKAKYMAVLSVLDRVNMAYAIALANGEIICLNESAKKTFAKKDGLNLTPDMKLRTSDSAIDAVIEQTVSSVANTVLGVQASAGRLITIPRRSTVEPFLMEISPLKDSSRELDDFIAGALITIIDTEEQAEISTNGLQALYQLTDAETAVADLMVKGYSNKSIANERDVSPETIKTQVEAILGKTKSVNRSALIRQVLTINLPVA